MLRGFKFHKKNQLFIFDSHRKWNISVFCDLLNSNCRLDYSILFLNCFDLCALMPSPLIVSRVNLNVITSNSHLAKRSTKWLLTYFTYHHVRRKLLSKCILPYCFIPFCKNRSCSSMIKLWSVVGFSKIITEVAGEESERRVGQ